MISNGIMGTPRTYTVTMVCPLCHRPISWNQAGITTCPHCNAAFEIKPVAVQDAALLTNHYEGKVGPSEVK
jgi:hypothetical protein